MSSNTNMSAPKDQTQSGVAVINTFPQPTRPVNSYYLEVAQAQPPQTSYPVTADNTENGVEEKEKFEELVRAVVESYEKLPANIRNQITLDKFRRNPSLVSKDLKVDSSSSRSIEGSVGDSPDKLERFKIKTIKLGGVVNGENKSSS
ncbi:hypothetical protein P3X46_009566 [Hevea brasiliensis]|uniref:Uncharacterized protein n=1 Tax=Hevea brasiliensis TaxID=3981 RepID=A0ABQ9MRB7_HEVBR|nr:hypothetical protein P3X46_009566 [Hevea brasiliensis]